MNRSVKYIKKKQKMGRGFKEKEEREALSEAINSKKKKKKINKNCISGSSLIFEKQKQKQNH